MVKILSHVPLYLGLYLVEGSLLCSKSSSHTFCFQQLLAILLGAHDIRVGFQHLRQSLVDGQASSFITQYFTNLLRYGVSRSEL